MTKWEKKRNKIIISLNFHNLKTKTNKTNEKKQKNPHTFHFLKLIKLSR